MSLTVEHFMDAARGEMELEIIGGKQYLSRVVPEPAMNRPGLALAGFLQYFANKRIQVMGLAELNYLKGLSPAERVERLRGFYGSHIPAVVVTRNRRPSAILVELAQEYRVPVIRSALITKDFIHQATLVMEDIISPRERVHGTMVDVMTVGVLIEGKPGIGKSEAALALIERGHSLVADDITVLKRDRSGDIICSAVDTTRYHMEIRGIGLIHVPSLFGVASMRLKKTLNLIVHLQKPKMGDAVDRTGLEPQHRDVFGVSIPTITIPVTAGRDLALLIETAALNQKLKLLGHDAAKELDDKIIAILNKNTARS